MKSVLISIRPEWCHLIASGKKTVEVRKTKPKLETPFKVYIYCTKDEPMYRSGEKFWCGNDEVGNGKVIGEFVCDTIITDKTFGHDALFKAAACMSDAEAAAYCVKNEMYGWHISDLVIYDEPRELSEFYQEGKNGEKFYYDYCAGCPHHETPVGEDPCNGCDGNRNYFYRPPQSWCYVEEVGR